MTHLKLAAACLNQTPLDWRGNAARIREAIAYARARNVAILCLPELCITGYGCEDAFYGAAFQRRALQLLQELVLETKGIVVAFGLPLLVDEELYDVACLAADGEIVGFVGKQNLARDGIHYEPRWFHPWPVGKTSLVKVGEREYPVGDLLFDFDGIRVGFEICEDAWVKKRPGARLCQQGVDILLNPSASHFAFGKYEVRKQLVLDGARDFGVAYVYANLIGNEAGRALYDGSCFIAHGKSLLRSARRFSYRDVKVLTAVVERDAFRQASLASEASAQLISSSFLLPAVDSPQTEEEHDEWEKNPSVKNEEFPRAVALGLFDYLRKSRSCGFVVSLSGGADSAAVALLCSLMIRFAIRDLGREDFLKKLSFLSLRGNEEKELAHELLTCVYQATANSSETTRTAAKAISKALGAEFYELNVEPLAAGYRELVAAALNIELQWTKHDVALQNIQARVRAPSVWMIANLKNALLLATSNRSEAAVGYTTMDGDTSGGLSPIAGVDKAFLLHWLRWMESTGPHGIGPMPELSAITAQAPTAELRPPQYRQRDEDDLMPYDVLDAIERAAIRDRLDAEEILPGLQAKFAKHGEEQLRQWIARFFILWSRNQWKRERYAPCFHLDDENLDPKTWCRWPILSGS